MSSHVWANVIVYQGSIGIVSRHIGSATAFFVAEINGSLTNIVTRNKSGTLLLTIRTLTHIRRGNTLFTLTAWSAPPR